MTLKESLADYLKNAPGWHKKASLYVVAEELGYSPETAGRKLRELAEEGTIAVEYYTGQRKQQLSKYSYDKPQEKKLIIKIINGIATKTYE